MLSIFDLGIQYSPLIHDKEVIQTSIYETNRIRPQK